MQFGIRPENLPESAPWYGCRAIYTPRQTRPPATLAEKKAARKTGGYITIPAELDIVPDRQSCNDPARNNPAFFRWLNERGTPALRGWLNSKYVNPGGMEQFTYRDGCHVITATPRGSYGYMYVGAWIDQNEAAPEGSQRHD